MCLCCLCTLQIKKERLTHIITEVVCCPSRDSVFVADGDGRKPQLLLVFDANVDVDRIVEVVTDAVLYLERGEGCSGDQQQNPDGPSKH